MKKMKWFMLFVHMLVVLVATSGIVLAQTKQKQAESLTFHTFELQTDAGNTLGKDVEWFVEFYAPWCEHCMDLEPIWDELAQHERLQERGNVYVGKVDCSKETPVCGRFGIRSYPTLIYFKEGVAHHYRDVRELDDLVDFVVSVNSGQEPSAKVKRQPVPEFKGPFLIYPWERMFNLPTKRIIIFFSAGAIFSFSIIFYCFYPRGKVEDFDYLFDHIKENKEEKTKDEQPAKESKKDR